MSLHYIILGLAISLIAYIYCAWNKDITDIDRSASYLDLHFEIDIDVRLRTKPYDKRDDINFPIVNCPFICNNIPAAPAYGVYISQLIRYSRACGFYQDVFDRWLLTRKLLDQGFLLVNLKSSVLRSPPWLGWPLWNICVTNGTGYAPPVPLRSTWVHPRSKFYVYVL